MARISDEEKKKIILAILSASAKTGCSLFKLVSKFDVNFLVESID